MPGALPAGVTEAVLLAEVTACLAGLPPGAAAVTGVSGGADSAALALLVHRARPDLALTAVHVRHGLREDARDAAAAASLASTLGIPFIERRVRVTRGRSGVEAAAREARYEALRQAARETGACAVLVGHTADDQAETVLLALARGAGVRGISAMAGSRSDGDLVLLRPILRARRADVRSVATAAGLSTVEDPTNADPDQRRARARHNVLPALASLSGGSGDPVGTLTRLAALARDDADLLDQIAAVEVAAHIVRWGPVRAVRAAAVDALPRAIARRVVRRLLEEAGGAAESAGVERVLALQEGGRLHVAGEVEVLAGAGWLSAAPVRRADLPQRDLPVPGAVELPEVGLVLRAAHGVPPTDASGPFPPRARMPEGPHAAAAVVLGADAAAGLVVRGLQPGDRIVGRRVRESMRSLGVPWAARGLVPVVALLGGHPVWAPGIAAAVPPAEPAVAVWVDHLG